MVLGRLPASVLLFLPSTACYQGMEPQKEFLPFEDVTFGVPYRQKRTVPLQTQPFWRSDNSQEW